MLRETTKACLLKAGGAPGRATTPTPVKSGPLRQMVAAAMRDEEEFWRYSIETDEVPNVTCSHIRRLAVLWNLVEA